VIGIRGPETTKILKLASEPGVRGRILFLEGVAEPELQWCYRHCEALLAPSLTEGFGAPVAEGIRAGCRIVCSDIPAHREIGDSHCRFVALHENPAEELAAAVSDALNEPKPSPRALQHMSAVAQAEQFVSIYQRLIDSATSAPMERAEGSSGGASSEAVVPAVVDGPSALAYRGK
jgi:glycosyltransferase involved in cell wall biosynthesis